MNRELRRIVLHPYFVLGVLLRLSLIALVVPAIQQHWFVPFVEGNLLSPSLDPWTNHLARGGDPMAFPYGPVMYLAFLPGTVVALLFQSVLGTTAPAPVAFGVTLLALELVLVFVMTSFVKERRDLLAWYVWLSPMAIYVSYWHGQLDLVPVVLLALTFLALKRERAQAAGVLLGLGVAAKLSVLLAAPFFLVYLWRNARWRALFIPFVVGLGATVALTSLPCILSPGFREIVLGSPEISKVHTVALELGGSKIFMLPVLYALILYGAWRIERMSFELFFIFVGIAFFSVLLLTPASTGWFLWSLPFVALMQARTGGTTAWLGMLFSVLFVATHFLLASGASVPLLGLDMTSPPATLLGWPASAVKSGLVSATWIVGALLCLQMVVHGVRRNDYFRLSRRPITIGIAGDSGSGKDTLAAALAGLFGQECVTSISGDDYHKWDRHAPMWKVLTHLDPRANDLNKFARDVLSLLDGKPVSSRHYDHETGRFRRANKVRRNDVVLVSGLHALFVNAIKQRLDLSIFLEMDEDLRTKLKVQRDVNVRGRRLEYVLKSIENRRPDADRYIRPQIQDADIIFSLSASDPDFEHVNFNDLRFRLTVTVRDGVFSEPIVHTLVGLCGMEVDTTYLEESGAVRMVIEGDLSDEDVALAARTVTPEMEELLGRQPAWHGGMLGVMQLISLSHVHNALQSRLSYA